jgi:hypothetical protein
MKDFGGGGNDSFLANLSGIQAPGSAVTLTFFGNGGNDTAQVFDDQVIAGMDLTSGLTAAGTFIDLHGGQGDDSCTVLFNGQLQGGLLQVSEDGGPGNDSLILDYEFAVGSTGTLISAQNGGPGNDSLAHNIRVNFGDNPFTQASTDGGPGFDRAVIGPGFVRVSNVERVTFLS